jgi:hypothetical protein
MKHDLAWHEECLRNMRDNYAREAARVEREKQELARREARIIALECQLAEAKRRGMNGFDPDRFLRVKS